MYPSDPNSFQVWWHHVVESVTALATIDAVHALEDLLGSFGAATEPDFAAIAPVYNGMLAIALLITGAVIAFALMERIVGGDQGVDWLVVPRVMIAMFVAYTGLAVVRYMAGYAALLATAWNSDYLQHALTLAQGVEASLKASPAQGDTHVNLVGLILAALFLNFMALLVYLELIVRSALILLVTAFVPFVTVLSIWPRLAPSAAKLAEYLVGLLLAKFVIATALFIGIHLVFPSLVTTGTAQAPTGWMANGIAILLITAFSPLVLFQGLHFAHGSASGVVRNWTSQVNPLVGVPSLAGIGGAVMAAATPRIGRTFPGSSVLRSARGRAAGWMRSAASRQRR